MALGIGGEGKALGRPAMKPMGLLVRPCSAGGEGVASTVGALLTSPSGTRPLQPRSLSLPRAGLAATLSEHPATRPSHHKEEAAQEGSPGEPVPERGLQLGLADPEPCHSHEAHSCGALGTGPCSGGSAGRRMCSEAPLGLREVPQGNAVRPHVPSSRPGASSLCLAGPGSARPGVFGHAAVLSRLGPLASVKAVPWG